MSEVRVNVNDIHVTAAFYQASAKLVEHALFVASHCQACLRDDVTELSEAVHDAFVSTMPTMATARQEATFRVGFFSDFDCGDDVVLVSADRTGMRMFQSAVRSAHDDGAASFEIGAIKHRVVREDGAADIELGSQSVVWRFDDKKLVELLKLVEPLVDITKPAHNYLDDLNAPAETLILSVDQYIDGGPFAVFPHGEPVPPPR